MLEAVKLIGNEIARQSIIELNGRTFGAVQAIELVGHDLKERENEDYWELTWRIDFIGDQRELSLIVLPEFLEMEPELLLSQLSMMFTERALRMLDETEEEYAEDDD